MRKDLSLFARRMRLAREQARMSQAELGAAIGVSDKSISAYEQDRAEPPFQKLKKIADLTHQSLNYFTDPELELDQQSLEAKLAALEKEIANIKQLLNEQKQNS